MSNREIDSFKKDIANLESEFKQVHEENMDKGYMDPVVDVSQDVMLIREHVAPIMLETRLPIFTDFQRKAFKTFLPLIQDGELTETVKRITELLKNHQISESSDRRFILLYLTGLCYQQCANTESALEWLQQSIDAIDDNSGRLAPYAYLSFVANADINFRNMYDFDKAELYADKSLDCYPYAAYPHIMKLKVYLQRNQIFEFLSLFKSCLTKLRSLEVEHAKEFALILGERLDTDPFLQGIKECKNYGDCKKLLNEIREYAAGLRIKQSVNLECSKNII